MARETDNKPQDDVTPIVMAPPLLVIPGVATPPMLAVSLAGRPWQVGDRTPAAKVAKRRA